MTHDSNHRRIIKMTEARMTNTAKIATKITAVMRKHHGRLLTSQEHDQISIISEEIALMLPDDPNILSSVNTMDADEIIRYIETTHDSRPVTPSPPRSLAGSTPALWVLTSFIFGSLILITLIHII